MFGGMKTVELFCPDPGGFKIAVRTNAVSDDSKRFLTSDANQNTAKSSLSTKVENQPFSEGTERPENVFGYGQKCSKGRILSHDDVVLKAG